MGALRWGLAVALAALCGCGSGAIGHDRDAPVGERPGGDGAAVPDGGADASDAGALDGARDGSGADGAEAGGDGGDGGVTYDEVVLADQPVAYWAMSSTTATEPDLTGHGHAGTYHGTPAAATLPNGDRAADFDGATQYLAVPAHADLSIPTTGRFTWEAWIRPTVLQFPHHSNGYVDWMGKCEEYSPSCEWEARLYNLTNPQGRVSRLSAYVFNPGAGLGSGADWQPEPDVIQAGSWYRAVGEYQGLTLPAACDGPEPGGINIWVNGVPWNQSYHGQTGCFSQYHVTAVAGSSPLNIGTMAFDSWFEGAIGKVAIYDVELPAAQIAAHYQAMTGRQPTGSCADTCTLQ